MKKIRMILLKKLKMKIKPSKKLILKDITNNIFFKLVQNYLLEISISYI